MESGKRLRVEEDNSAAVAEKKPEAVATETEPAQINTTPEIGSKQQENISLAADTKDTKSEAQKAADVKEA